MTIRVQFVGQDGCYRLRGVRVRCAPGYGDGSLEDEYLWGLVTPLAGDEARRAVLSCIADPELAAFVRSLPVARLEPAPGRST